jgi:P4 family phage/plasmid primase-like protien
MDLIKQLRQLYAKPKKGGVGEHYNLVGMGEVYRGRYYVDAYSDAIFWKLYNKKIESNQEVCLAEVPLNQSVVRLDVDISVKMQGLIDSGETENIKMDFANLCYTEDVVKNLVVLANGLLKEMLRDVDDENLSCFLLEKDARIKPIKGDDKNIFRVKRGFHLHWPLLVTNNAEQKKWINALIQKCNDCDIFSNPEDAIESNNTCPIDALSADVAWLLYGSRKPSENTSSGIVKNEPYEITRALDASGNDMGIDTLFDQIKLIDLFDDNVVDTSASRAQKLTIRPRGRRVFQFIDNVDTWTTPKPSSFLNNPSVSSSDSVDLDQVRSLLTMLSYNRCFEYIQWINVGKCLFTTTLGSCEGLDIWTNWSMNCVEKFADNACSKKWSAFKVGNYGINMLKKWAKDDSPTEYSKWRQEIFAKSLDSFKKNTSGEIAAFSKRVMEEDSRVFKYSGETWYEFDGRLWVCHTGIGGDMLMMTLLNKKVKPYVEDMCLAIEPIPQNKSKLETHQSVIKKLDEPGNLGSIIQMLRIEYFDKGFHDSLDTNYNLIGLQNGVYDLNACEFRPGRPEDCISSSITCDYIEYAEDSIELIELKRHLQRFFPNPERRAYMMDVLCQMFVGNLKLKNLFFWVGKGNNGKTAFSRIIEEMLGKDYCVKLPTTLLSGSKSAAGKASPELCMLLGKRIAFLDEPDAEEDLGNGMIKQLTGHDTLQPRDLFQKGKEVKKFINRAIPIMLCNSEPKVKTVEDEALWSRFRVCAFESTFVDVMDAKPTFEEQLAEKKFPIDYDFVNNVEKIKAPLCFYLLQNWKRTRNTTLDTPDCVLASTNNYKRNNDWLSKFIANELVDDPMGIVDIATFKDRFYTFLSQQNYNARVISSNKIIVDIRQMGINVTHDGIIGKRFIV